MSFPESHSTTCLVLLGKSMFRPYEAYEFKFPAAVSSAQHHRVFVESAQSFRCLNAPIFVAANQAPSPTLLDKFSRHTLRQMLSGLAGIAEGRAASRRCRLWVLFSWSGNEPHLPRGMKVRPTFKLRPSIQLVHVKFTWSHTDSAYSNTSEAVASSPSSSSALAPMEANLSAAFDSPWFQCPTAPRGLGGPRNEAMEAAM